MTNDRPKFAAKQAAGYLPVVEGRMVHQFRFPVKGYMSGSGRRARWLVQAPGAPICPQFWINPDSLRPETAARVREARIGFCDVTGQTNERTVLAARIPADVVCGNKVPTIKLATTMAPHNEMTDVWLAVANSLTFDWLARRVVTTSLNFFLLRSLPFPAWERLRANWEAIARISAQLSASSNGAPPSPGTWAYGELRAEIEALVAASWGLSPDNLTLILGDFPLLDRGQPCPPGDRRSTVTRDLVMLHFATMTGQPTAKVRTWQSRVDSARDLGAVAFRTSEHVGRVE